MRPFDLLRGVHAIVMTIVACMSGFAVAAVPLRLDGEGWFTWTVTAQDNAPDWCCYSWRSGSATRSGCDLDGKSSGFGSSDESVNDTGELQIYALRDEGIVQQVRAYSPRCPVVSESAITDLGHVPTAQSLDWLQRQIGKRPDLTTQSLAAMSGHESALSAAALIAAVENRKLRREDRKQAIFWLVQSGSDEALAYFDRIFSET